MNYMFYSKLTQKDKETFSVSVREIKEEEFDKVVVIRELLSGLLLVQYNDMEGYLITSKNFYENKKRMLKNEATFLHLYTYLIDSDLTMDKLFALTDISYSNFFFTIPSLWNYFEASVNKFIHTKIYLFIKNTTSFLFFLGRIKYLKKILEN